MVCPSCWLVLVSFDSDMNFACETYHQTPFHLAACRCISTQLGRPSLLACLDRVSCRQSSHPQHSWYRTWPGCWPWSESGLARDSLRIELSCHWSGCPCWQVPLSYPLS